MSERIPLFSRRPRHSPYTLVIHGGAGVMNKERSTPEQRAGYKQALSQALLAGYQILHNNGTAMDAAIAAVTVMEDIPLFNAGKGAVFNVAGQNELEASLMLSKPPSSHPEIPKSRRGLSLALLTRAKNPAQFVRALYLNPAVAPHAFLSGNAAELLGQSLGETLVDPSYFFTEQRWREHRRGLGLPEEPLPHLQDDDKEDLKLPFIPADSYPTGTVGAVALDQDGCIAALTSTGGRTNKLVGRIGDTPHMGAGFWAEEWNLNLNVSFVRRFWNKLTRRKQEVYAVGVSGTGDGDVLTIYEYFIRQSTAITIAHRIRFRGEPLDKAASETVRDLLELGGIGGVIALDNKGSYTMTLNCPGMYRGVIKEDGVPKTAIFRDEEVLAFHVSPNPFGYDSRSDR